MRHWSGPAAMGIAVFLAASCGANQAQPVDVPPPTAGPEPGSEASPAPRPEAPAEKAPTLSGDAPGACPGLNIPKCSDGSGAATISALLASADGANVRVRGTVVLGETGCTRSVPSNCTTALHVVEVGVRSQGRIQDPGKSALLAGKNCGGPSGCCALQPGGTYVFEGMHRTRQLAGPASSRLHELEIDSVCEE